MIGDGKVVVLPSAHPASLQFYAHAANDNVLELEVAPSNRVSRADERPIQPARVEHVAVTDGWMATVDTWSAEGFAAETYLKLWRSDPGQLSFAIDTRVDRPHGNARVQAIAFTSRAVTEPLLVTVANEPDLKIWAYVRVKSGKKMTGASTLTPPRLTMQVRGAVAPHSAIAACCRSTRRGRRTGRCWRSRTRMRSRCGTSRR